MARNTFDGYGITELRHWARDLKIAGRSKMAGGELVAACKAQARANVVAAEQAVLTAVTIEPGTTLLRHKATGAVMRVTGPLVPYVRDGVNYESLCFTAEYVTAGTRQPGQSDNVEHLNRMDALSAANGYALQHMLYQFEAISA